MRVDCVGGILRLAFLFLFVREVGFDSKSARLSLLSKRPKSCPARSVFAASGRPFLLLGDSPSLWLKAFGD